MNNNNYLINSNGYVLMQVKNVYNFGGCCPKRILFKNIYNPEVISKFSPSTRLSIMVNSSVGTNNNCVNYANQKLNVYGKWAGCPGGSGAGYSSTMRYMPSQNSSGYGPRVGGPATIDRNG